MTGWLATPWAFFVRDFQLAVSYRAGFVLGLGGAVVNVLLFFFLSRFFGPLAGSLDDYGGSYFGFVVIGIAFSSFMAIGLSGLATKIREAQMMGTLELMVVSPTRLPVSLLASSLWSHAFALLTVGAYFVAGALLGMDLGNANLAVGLLGMLLAVVSFNALGLLAASVVIVIKQGGPVNWLVSTASVLLAGVFYPASVLPGWLQTLGQVLPLTHALEIVRRSMLLGEGLDTLWPSFVALLLLTVIFLPLGLLACHLAVRAALRDGSLTNY